MALIINMIFCCSNSKLNNIVHLHFDSVTYIHTSVWTKGKQARQVTTHTDYDYTNHIKNLSFALFQSHVLVQIIVEEYINPDHTVPTCL